MDKKIVVHINTGMNGGPGGIVNSVYDALKELGYENYIIAPRGKTDKNIKILGKFDFYFSRILSKIFEKTSNLKGNGFYPEIFCSNKTKRINKTIGKNIDYIILYWHKNYIDYKTIRDLAKTNNCKIFIYPMDYYLLSGACHYPENCNKYKEGCGSCPGIFNGLIRKDFTYNYVKKMSEILKLTNTTIICGSNTVLDLLNNNLNLKDIKKEILIPPLSNKYQEVQDITKIKKEFQLKSDNKIIFFGAENLKNERKGFKYLLNTLKYLSKKLSADERRKITLLIAGNGELESIEGLGFNISKVGYLNRKDLIKAYQVSDIFISASIKDGGPMMVKESIMAGTPVVCFKNVGNAKEFVLESTTGYRAEFKNSSDMGEKVLKILRMSKTEYKELRKNCLEIGKKKMSYSSFQKNIEKILKEGV